MPTYKITDPTTNKTLRLTGDSPPTEQELNDIFSQLGESQPQKPTTQFLPGESRVEKLQEGRTDSVARLREEAQTPFDFKNKPFGSLMKPLVTGIKTSAVPIQRGESAVAGLGLGLQKGDVGEGIRRFGQGITGKKQQELGDLIRTTGFAQNKKIPLTNISVNEAMASSAGLIATFIAPFKKMKDANKALNKIQKASDKGLLRAGDDLIKGADDAVRVVGQKLDDAYLKINKVQVEPSKILDDIVELPQQVIKHLEKNVGNLDDFLDDFNIEKARKLKRVLGEIKPSSFGKAEKGAVELVQDKQINKAYAGIKKAMEEGLSNSGLKKEANILSKADDAFVDTLNASKFIKKTIVDPTLRKPTKTGSIALRLAKEGDLTGRTALNTLKSAGSSANKSIIGAVDELDKFNRAIAFARFGKVIVRGAAVGGAAGLIGGKTFGAFE